MSDFIEKDGPLINGLHSRIAALEAQLEKLRDHLGTLTPGGSHTCITCAAHCVAIEDLEARCATLTAEVVHYTAGTPHPLEARCRELEQDCARIASENACNQVQIHKLE